MFQVDRRGRAARHRGMCVPARTVRPRPRTVLLAGMRSPAQRVELLRLFEEARAFARAGREASSGRFSDRPRPGVRAVQLALQRCEGMIVRGRMDVVVVEERGIGCDGRDGRLARMARDA